MDSARSTSASLTGMNRYAGTVAIIVAASIWGTSGTAATFIADATPVAKAAVSVGGGGLMFALLSIRSVVQVVRMPGMWRILLLGGVASTLFAVGFYTGMAWAGVAIGTILTIGFTPIFASVFEWVVDGIRPSARWLVSTLVTLVGCGLLVFGAGRGGHSGEHLVLPGVFLAFAGAVGYAGYTFLVSKLLTPTAARPISPPRSGVIGGMLAVTTLLLLPIAVTQGHTLISDPTSLLASLYLMLVVAALGHLLLGFALSRLKASTVTVYNMLEPAVAVILAWAVVGERISTLGWCGLMLVGAGLALLSVPQHQQHRVYYT